MADSTKKTRRKKVSKPPKPYPEFPLTPHNGGSWMKKINGTIFYFGKWGKLVNAKMERLPGDGWREALDDYKASVDIIRRTGRKPRFSDGEGLTLKDLCNKFLTAETRKKVAGELSHRTFLELNQTTDRLMETFGNDRLVSDIGPKDFESLRAEIAAKWGPVRLTNEITRIKSTSDNVTIKFRKLTRTLGIYRNGLGSIRSGMSSNPSQIRHATPFPQSSLWDTPTPP